MKIKKLIIFLIVLSFSINIPVYAKPKEVLYSNQESLILNKLKKADILEYTYQLKQYYENNSFGILKPTILTYKVKFNSKKQKFYIKASSIIDISGQEVKNKTDYIYNIKTGKLIKESKNLEGTEKLTDTMLMTLGINKRHKSIISLYKYLISSNIITSTTKGVKAKNTIKYVNTYKSNNKEKKVKTNIKTVFTVKNNIPIKIHSKMNINIQNLKTKNDVTITFNKIKAIKKKKEVKNATKKK